MNKNLCFIYLLCAALCTLFAGCSSTAENTSSNEISASEQIKTTVTEEEATSTEETAAATNKSETTTTVTETEAKTTSTDSENDYHGLSVD